MRLATALLAALISQSASAQQFHGYDCTDDCSGHEAGYEWAARKGIDNPDDCGGRSASFIEGCRIWAEENSADDEDDDDDGDEWDDYDEDDGDR